MFCLHLIYLFGGSYPFEDAPAPAAALFSTLPTLAPRDTDAGSHGFAYESDEGDEGPGMGQPWVIPLLVPAIFIQNSWKMRKIMDVLWYHGIIGFHLPAQQFWGMNPYKSQLFWCEQQGLTMFDPCFFK